MMNRMQKLVSVFSLVVIFTACFPACIQKPVDHSLTVIRSRKVLRVGVRPGMPGFCYLVAGGGYDGLEIALAQLLAKAIIGPSGQVEFIPVDAQSRNILLDRGEVDMVIANFTITEKRKQRFNFSTAYYSDSIGVMVKKGSGIRNLSDLNGKTVGVVRDSTTVDIIKTAAQGFDIDIVEFSTFYSIKSALDAGTVDAFSIDKPILLGLLDDTVELIPAAISIQGYGVASRILHKKLARTVDTHIEKWLADGTIESLIEKYNL